MVTASATVKKIISESPLLHEGLRQGLMNYAAVAEKIKPQVEQQLGSRVTDAAVIMALRRQGDELGAGEDKRAKQELRSQLILKTGLVYFSVKRSPQLFRKLEELHRLFNQDAGDTLNIIHGNSEVSVITNDKYAKKVGSILEKEQVMTRERGLVSISMSLPKDFAYTPGVVFAATRKLYWDNVNIFELVTTATELTFIFMKKDAMRAYASLQELTEE